MPQKKRGPLHGSKQGLKHQLSTAADQLGAPAIISTATGSTRLDENARLRLTWESHAQELEKRTWPNSSSLDPFSKEVLDLLVEIFFEFCFEDFNFFSPARFLKSYSRGTANPNLLNAICAVAARFSNHPAIVTTPPCKSGEPFALRIRSRMGDLVAEGSIDTIHTLIILSFYEYTAGNHLRGYRFEGMAGRMAPEIQLHRAYAKTMRGPFGSEEERVTTEINVRTFAFILNNDSANSGVANIPPLFDSSQFEPWIVPFEADWWVEQRSSGRPVGTQKEEPMDPFYVSILHKTLRPRPIRGFGDSGYTVPILKVAISVWGFTGRSEVPETPLSDQSGPSLPSSPSAPSSPSSTSSSHSTTAVAPPNDQQQGESGLPPNDWRKDIPDIQRLDAAAEAWRQQLPEEYLPSRARSCVWRTDMNLVHPALYYYTLLISLYRPVLMKAGMEAGERATKIMLSDKGNDVAGAGGEDTTNIGHDAGSSDMAMTDADEDTGVEGQMFLRMAMEKCSKAANEITAIVDQFTERLVRIRGSHLSFPIFIAGTAHVLQLMASKDPTRVAQARKGLLTCIRFFRILGPYWAASDDQARFLQDLLDTHTAKTESKDKEQLQQPTILEPSQENCSMETEVQTTGDPVISAALALLEMNNFGTNRHPDTNIDPGTSLDLVTATTTASVTGTSSNDYGNGNTSTKPSGITAFVTGPEEANSKPSSSAFLTTDAGLGMMWREPGKLEALEKATLQSLESLSLLS
ncbi:hypothetical protein BGX33_009248 [Mortierella sp. NVP41]|nr:hypothetical protein BGX33_009248 [Mortierella sp. NVP41]